MSSTIRVVKRKDREASGPLCTPHPSSAEVRGRRENGRTVTAWISESDRREAEAKLAFQFMRGLRLGSGFEPAAQMAKCYLTTLCAACLMLLSAHGAVLAQSP